MAVAVNGHADGPTIPASADTLLRFQPGREADAPERDDAPVWLLAGPSERLRAAYRAGLVARGIRNPSDDELVNALAFALELARSEMDAAQFAKFAGILERHQALPILDADEKPSFDRMAIAGGMAMLYRTCREGNEELDRLLKMRETWFVESLKVACGFALRGAEHYDGTIEVLGEEATAATLAAIPEVTRQMIGLHWLTQSQLSAAQKKTSDSAPLSDTTPTTIPPANASVPSLAAIDRSHSTTRGTKRTRTTLAT